MLEFPLDDPSPLDPGALAEGERARADRFLSDLARRRFVACRLEVRRQLGSLLGVDPASLRFEVHPGGKPVLADHPSLHFNVSHSGGWGLLAWLADCPVGVDVEVWRPLRDRDALARRWFSGVEQEQYESAAETDREAVFFALWTHKEAVIKADGRGLRIPLRSFDVLPGSPGSGLGRRPAGSAATWTLRALPQPPGRSAAIAVQGDSLHIRSADPSAEWASPTN